MLQKFKRALVFSPLAAVLGFAGSAHASIDLTAITGAITAADVTVGVLAIAGILATIYATILAAKTALNLLRRGQG